MAGGILSGCKNLNECEEVLARLIQPGELLGRIPLGPAEWKGLENVLAKVISKYGDNHGSTKIWTNWPACASVYLVHAGIRLYRAGKFWPMVRENIGITENITAYWGERFIAFLKKHQLPTFNDIGGLRYITPILGHGGIPNYCLDDFFKYILSRAEAYWGLNGEDLLEELLHESYVSFADKPVQRFLANGGEYAADFLMRCLEMAREVKKEDVQYIEKFGLPDRIVKVYHRWIQENAGTSEVSEEHFRSPFIKYDPYGLGVVAYLPGQRLNLGISSIHWKIITEKSFAKKIRCSPWRSGVHIAVREEEVPLEPANQYSISFIIDGIEKRRWVIKAFEDRPFLAFNPDNGRLQRSNLLSGQEAWIIVNKDWEVIGQDSRVIEEFPPIGISWRHYYAVAVDFGSEPVLQLSNPDNKTIIAPIANKIVKPCLVGGEEFARCDDYECLIYTNKLPFIRLPKLPDTQNSYDWWSRWLISVYHDSIVYLKTINVGDYYDYLYEKDNYYLFPLDVPNFLEKRVGRQKLVVRGPLGYDAKLELIIFPDIELYLSSENLWPRGYKGYSKIDFSLVLSKSYNMSFNSSSSKLVEKKKLKNGDYQCLVGELFSTATHISGRLNILDQTYDFSKNVRPFRWGWLGLKSKGTVDWQGSIIEISIQELEENDITLVLQVQKEHVSGIHGEMSLESVYGKVYYTEPFNFGRSRIIQLPLIKLKDTLYYYNQATYEMWINIFRDGKLVTKYCPVKIIRDWKISNIELITDNLSDAFESCRLHWTENFILEEKVLRIWNVWRPWEDPMVFNIEGKKSSVSIDLSTRNLTPAIYRFEISKIDEMDDFREELRPNQFPAGKSCNVRDFPIKTKEWGRYISGIPSTIEGLLEGYQALSNSFSGAQDLMPRENIIRFSVGDAQKVLAVCHVAAIEKDYKSFCDLMEMIKIYLNVSNTLTLLKAVAHWISEGKMLDIKVVTGLGLDLMPKHVDIFSQLEEWESQALWSFWPALGFLSDLNGGHYSLLYKNMMEYCGREGMEKFFNRTFTGPFHKDGNLVCDFDLPQCLERLLNFDCICEYIVPKVPQAIIGDMSNANLIAQKNDEELDFMHTLIAPYPDGIFHPDFIVDTIFKWLKWVKAQNLEDAVNKMVVDYLSWADKSINYFLEKEMVNPDIIQVLKSRKFRYRGSIPLVNFPYLVGACALIRRVQSRSLEIDLTDKSTGIIVRVSEWCPALYGHDLCLFELLLNIWL